MDVKRLTAMTRERSHEGASTMTRAARATAFRSRPAAITLRFPRLSATRPKIIWGRLRLSCLEPFISPASATEAPAATAMVPMNLSIIVSEKDWAAPVAARAAEVLSGFSSLSMGSVLTLPVLGSVDGRAIF